MQKRASPNKTFTTKKEEEIEPKKNPNSLLQRDHHLSSWAVLLVLLETQLLENEGTKCTKALVSNKILVIC